jgi:hypothetical protein
MIQRICQICVLPAFLFLGCGTTSAKPSSEPVKFYNAFRTGSETQTLPTAIDGCESLGSITASTPELEMSLGADERATLDYLLATLDLHARRRGADIGVVLIELWVHFQGQRTLRANLFRCGDHPVPPEMGMPIG